MESSPSTMCFINPYALLGVTHDSTLDELRKAYYAMSLLCHPDKGGTAHDMACVHSAYAFVKNELTMVEKHATVNLKDLECQFAEFHVQQQQTSKDVHSSAFNEVVQEVQEIIMDAGKPGTSFCPPAFPDLHSGGGNGYGDLMDNDGELDTPIKHRFAQVIKNKPSTEAGSVNYAEMCMIVSGGGCKDREFGRFSVSHPSIPMFDYMTAFADVDVFLDENIVDPRVGRHTDLEAFIAEREKLYS